MGLWLCSQKRLFLRPLGSLQPLKALAPESLAGRTSIAVRSGIGVALPRRIATRSPHGQQRAKATQPRRAFWRLPLQRRPCQAPLALVQSPQRQLRLRRMRWSLARIQKLSLMQAGPFSRIAQTRHRWFLVVPMRASTL